MELFARNHDPSWDRVVHLYVDKKDGVSDYINDKDTYKLIVVNEGSLTIESSEYKRVVLAPALVLITNEEVKLVEGNELLATTVFLRPTEIREEFTLEKISSGDFEKEQGRTIYQDYLLVKSFMPEKNQGIRVLSLGLSAHSRILKLIELMDYELTVQEDDFWPCRSRSYMMELLYFISYVCAGDKSNGNDIEQVVSSDTVSEVIQYLNEHIGDKLALEDIMKEFGINRNRLNDLFVKETSMTCMNYLEKLRVNLAQVMLAETELLIGEIAQRVGYTDSNYFIKVFKKNTGVTPSKYRESFSEK